MLIIRQSSLMAQNTKLVLQIWFTIPNQLQKKGVFVTILYWGCSHIMSIGLRYTLVTGSEHHHGTEGIECTWLNGQVGGGAKTPPLLPPLPLLPIYGITYVNTPRTRYLNSWHLVVAKSSILYSIASLNIPSGRDWANLFKPFDHFSCLISALMDKKM